MSYAGKFTLGMRDAYFTELFEIFKRVDIRQVGYVPDAGHARLIDRCRADPDIRDVVLTTEEEGVALAAGAYALLRHEREELVDFVVPRTAADRALAGYHAHQGRIFVSVQRYIKHEQENHPNNYQDYFIL